MENQVLRKHIENDIYFNKRIENDIFSNNKYTKYYVKAHRTLIHTAYIIPLNFRPKPL